MLAIALALAPAGAPAWAQGARLRVLVEDAAEPFSNPDGSGYANEVVEAAFAAAGVTAELVVVPYARCKALVLAGAEPACFSMSWEPEFQGVVRFAQQPLFSVTPVYFQNRRRPLKARSEGQLGPGVSIGVVNGYEYPDSTLKARERGVRFEMARSELVNLKKLALGRIDAALVMESALRGTQQLVQEAGAAHDVSAAFASTRLDSHIGFSLKHPRGEAALADFNRGYALIAADGTLRRIAAKWAAAR